jgi:hypothetical protein
MKLFFHLGENSRLATENLRTFSLGYDNSEDVEQNEKFMFITPVPKGRETQRFLKIRVLMSHNHKFT